MAKKNWRDSGPAKPEKPSSRSGWASSAGSAKSSSGLGGAGKFLFLLAAAGLLGGLIAVFLPLLVPEVQTPLLFCDAYPSSEGDKILSTNAFSSETRQRLEKSTSNDLATIPANIRAITDAEFNSSQKVVFFYLYADLFVAENQQPYLLAHDRLTGQSWDANAIQPSANIELRKFLEDVCRWSKLGNKQRVVVLDCGRLDASAFSNVAPEPIYDAVQSVLKILRDDKVENSDKLWILLSTDNYQLGWNSPELCGSVFGYFFSAGLQGFADRNDDQSISLSELNLYLQDAVSKWVENYRDSVQTPRLLSGGDIAESEKIHLLYHHKNAYEQVDGLANAQSLHDRYWERAFSIPQPHRRQMVCARLVRLEQLRFCKSKEYAQLLKQVETMLLEADAVKAAELPATTSIWDSSLREQWQVALNPIAIKEFDVYLNPPPKDDEAAAAPAAKDEPKSSVDESAKATDQTDDKPTGSLVVAKSGPQPQDSGVFSKPIGTAIKHLSSPQRLALVWKFLNSQPSGKAFSEVQLRESLSFIRKDDAANQECDDYVEMQLLSLLFQSLPWDKVDFDESFSIAAIQCFEASQTLANVAPIDRNNSQIGSATNQAWMAWRHVDPIFQQLENRRRYALDQAIGGESAAAAKDLGSLVAEYAKLRQQLLNLVQSRTLANDLLFVVPYLKSFTLRDTAFRQHQKAGARDFCLPLDKLAELQKTANEMLALLSGPTMTIDGFENLKSMTLVAEQAAAVIRGECEKITIESSQTQSASKYVFDSLGLLSTPLPEWIDGGKNSSATTRSAIVKQLESQLKTQQAQFFKNPAAAERRDLGQIEEIADRHRKIVNEQLAEFKTTFNNLNPASNNSLGLGGNANWNEVQSSIEKLSPLEKLKNSDLARADFSFTDVQAVYGEMRRLESLDRELRLAGPVIGLAESASDIYQQQIRLNQFAVEFRLGKRALDDFWGMGDVAKLFSLRPPFDRQVHAHAKNLTEIASESKNFLIDGRPYMAYDSDSMKNVGMELAKDSQSLWDKFSRLQTQWEFNETQVPLLEHQLRIEESAAGSELQIKLNEIATTLTGPAFSRVEGSPVEPVVGQRIVLERRQYYGPFDIPAAIRNARATGTIDFRGHQFKNELFISRKVIERLPPELFVFQPKYRANDTSMIMVENDIDNEVDLVFLIDCSRSMDDGSLKKVKEATREIMLELADEKRFHIGLAAFAHRGEFTDERVNGKLVLEDGKFPIKGNHHPFDDWQMLAKVPSEVSDEQQVTELCDRFLSPLQPRGFTPLYFSIIQTLPFVSNSDRKNILVVVTDGIDSQYPDGFSSDPRAEPKPVNGRSPRPSTINDLNEAYRKYAGRVNVLVLETKPNINNQMPTGFKSLALGSNTITDMKARVLDFVGRYKFSVTKKGIAPTANDVKPMGQTVQLSVVPDTEYVIQTHGVPTGSSQQTLKLIGGEDYKFINTSGGLKLAPEQVQAARDGFLAPLIEDAIALGNESYQVGRRQSNQLNNVRIGFANKRGISQFPGRVWAHVRDEKGREFEMTYSTMEFSDVPTYEFQMPTGFRENKIEMTVYIKPRGGISSGTTTTEEGEPAFSEFTGEGTGEFRGLKYTVEQNENSQTRFTVTITSTKGPDEPLRQDFHLACPNSVSFDGMISKRTLTFADVNRTKEVFEFDIPTGQAPIFKLHTLFPEKWDALRADVPTVGKAKTGTDPIFGDEVSIVEFGEIQVKN